VFTEQETEMRLITILLVLALGGCTDVRQPGLETKELEAALQYRWDGYRSVCFALLASNTHSGWQVVSLTYVPLEREECR
jgi:hypothetical protein